MKPIDMAKKFLEKAAQDEVLLDKVLEDHEVADEIIGFHCQQAVEKTLKALLAYHQIEFRKTHDLAELMDMLTDNGYPMPVELSDLDILNPFAVEYRYSLFSSESSVFDRKSARELVRNLRIWVEKQLIDENICPKSS